MASAVVSASTSPLSSNSANCFPASESPHIDNPEGESSLVLCNRDLTNSVSTKDAKEKEEQHKKVQRIPDAFEIRCKKDKGSSTSSPFKVWRPISHIQPSESLTKSFHRLSLNPDSLPQSPCTYQEKLLKERLNVQGNPDLEQKPLIHPKFLMSAKSSKNNEKGCPPLATVNSNSPSTVIPTSNISNIACSTLESLTVMTKEKQIPEDKCKKGKDNICNNISKYEESERKQIKAKMKAYAHMKKHILNYESQEAEVKDVDDITKKTQDKIIIKPLKHKPECPKCQSKSSESKNIESTTGKSFHIQAYKAYKNKSRENTNGDKPEVDAAHNKDQNIQHPNIMIRSDIASNQSSMHFLKPCEEAIAFYETSRNPKMTSSYPMASQEKKLKKKSNVTKEPGLIIHPKYVQMEAKNSKPKENSLQENILSLSSGVFYDGEIHKPQNDHFITGNNAHDIPINNLSHPTCSISCKSPNPSKAYCFNVPAPTVTTNTQLFSSGLQNKRHSSYEGGSCVNNLIKMTKEELFEYEKNRSLLRDLKGKSESKKVVTKSANDRACLADEASKSSNHKDQDISNGSKNKQELINDMNKEDKESSDSLSKEERDYFDYTYRLCYVDCTKYDGDLSACANCSVEENGIEKECMAERKCVPDYLKNRETAHGKTAVDSSMKSKGKMEDNCLASLDQTLQFETKSCSELNKWLSSINDSLSIHKKASVSSTKQPKERTLPSNQLTTQGKCCATPKLDPPSSTLTNRSRASSFGQPGTGSQLKGSCLPSSSPSQINHVNCALHPDTKQTPLSMNRYNYRNSTFETFSPSMSQPIFSVLPIEGYRVDTQLPMKNGNFACQTASQADPQPQPSKYQGDAVARRALKQRVKSKEGVRLSTCSIQSANEIHILKLHSFGDAQCSIESENQAKPPKESSSHHKNSAPGTLQVRYIPKQFSSSKNKVQVQTTAHAQIKRDSTCINGSVTSPSTHPSAMRYSPPNSQHSGTVCHIAQPACDQNGICASGGAGPDLLQVSVIQPGTQNKSDSSDQSSSSPPKKQSFFSRFAHSPLSFFYKDTKNNSSK